MKPGEWRVAKMGKRVLGYWYMCSDGRVFYSSFAGGPGMTYEERFGRSGS